MPASRDEHFSTDQSVRRALTLAALKYIFDRGLNQPADQHWQLALADPGDKRFTWSWNFFDVPCLSWVVERPDGERTLTILLNPKKSADDLILDCDGMCSLSYWRACTTVAEVIHDGRDVLVCGRDLYAHLNAAIRRTGGPLQ